MKKIIVSYCRVSTKKQSKDGIGLDIQVKSNNTAIERLMEDDRSLVRLGDITESESAFKGDNIDTIMSVVETGAYANGSIIVIYDQTRFSRMKPVVVITLMHKILESGFKIYFSAANETVDNLDKIDKIILPLVNAGAAHAESENRSNRTKDSYQTRIKEGKAIYSGHLPSWIDKVYDEGKIVGIELNEERGAVIEKIYNLYIDGLGANAIVGWLNEQVEPWGNFDYRRKDKSKRFWGESAVSKILRNPSVIGHRTFNRTNEHEEITAKDYYPPAISQELFYKAQEIRKNRVGSQVHRTKHPSIIYIGLAHCGYCGGKIVPQNFKSKRAAVRCNAHAKQQTTECAGGSSPARFLEKVLIELCRDEVNYNLLFHEKADVSGLRVKKATLEHEVEKLEQGVARVLGLFKEGLVDAVVFKKDTEKDNERLKSIRNELVKLDAEIDAAAYNSTGDETEFLELLKQVDADDIPNDIRLKLKDLLRVFISRIDIYRYGAQWKTEKQWEKFKDLVQGNEELIKFSWDYYNPFEKDRANLSYCIAFKNGAVRYIAFDYKTETWSFTANSPAAHLHSAINTFKDLDQWIDIELALDAKTGGFVPNEKGELKKLGN